MNSKKSKRANMGDQANRVMRGNHFEKQKSMDEKELRDRMEAAEAMFTLSSLPIFMPPSPSPTEEIGKTTKREAACVVNGLNPPYTSSQPTVRSPGARSGDSETRTKSAMSEPRTSVDVVGSSVQVGTSKAEHTQVKVGGSKQTITQETGPTARIPSQDLLTQIRQHPTLLHEILIRSLQAQQLQQQQQQSHNFQRSLQQPQQAQLASSVATKTKPPVPVVLGVHNLPVSLPLSNLSYSAMRKVSKDPPPQKVVTELKTSTHVVKSEIHPQPATLSSDILSVKKPDTAENTLPLKKRRLFGMRDSPSPEKVVVQHALSPNQCGNPPNHDVTLSGKMQKNEAVVYKSSTESERGTTTGEPSKPSGYLPLQGNPSTSLMVLSEVRNALVPDEDGDLPLHIAVVHENIEMVQKFVDLMMMTNKSIDRFNKAHQTPLHLAVLINCLEAVRILLKGGANPNLVDKEGYTSIHLAVKLNQSQCLTILLTESKHVLDVNYRNYQGYAPIHTGVEMMSKDLVRQLLDAHADINITDGKSGRSALFHAVETRQEGMVDFLQSREANIDLPNYAGVTPLLYAQTRNFNVISSILLKGIDGNRVSLDRVQIPKFHVKSESSMSPISNRTMMSMGEGSSSNVSSPCQSGRGSPMDLSGAASHGSHTGDQNSHVSHTDSHVSHTDVSCLPELEKRLRDTSNLGDQRYAKMSRLLFDKMETNLSETKSSVSHSKMLSAEQNDSKDNILAERLHQMDKLRDKVSELKFPSPGNPPVHSEEAKRQVGQRNSSLLHTKSDNSNQDAKLTAAQISASSSVWNIKVEPTTPQSPYPQGYSQGKILQHETEVSQHETKVYQNETKLFQHEIKEQQLSDDVKVFQSEKEDSKVSSGIHGSKIQTLYFLDGTNLRPLQVIIDGETMTPVSFTDTNSVESIVLNSVLQRVSQTQEKDLKHDSVSGSVSTSENSSLPGSGMVGWDGEVGKKNANSHPFTSNKNTVTQETYHIKTERQEGEMEKGLLVPVSLSSANENSKSVPPSVIQVQRHINKSDLRNSPNAGKGTGSTEGDEQQVSNKKIKLDTKKNVDSKSSSSNKPKRTTKRDEMGTSSSSEKGSTDSVPNLTLMSFPPGPGPNISKKPTNPVTVGSCLIPGRVPSTVANPRPAPVMTEGTLTRVSPAIKAKISQALMSQRKQGLNRVQPPQSD